MALRPLRRRTDAPRRAARRWSKDHATRALVAVAVILLSVVIALQALSDHADQAQSTASHAAGSATVALAGVLANQTRLQQEASGECQRVQRLRDDVNDAFAALHQAFDLAATLNRHVAGNGRQRRLADRVARLFVAYASHVRYIPPTNCAAATLHPDAYVPPTPRLFSLPQKRAAAIRLVGTH